MAMERAWLHGRPAEPPSGRRVVWWSGLASDSSESAGWVLFSLIQWVSVRFAVGEQDAATVDYYAPAQGGDGHDPTQGIHALVEL